MSQYKIAVFVGSLRRVQLTPVVISVLDYTKGFGHTDFVTC